MFTITNEENIDIRKELPVGTYTVMFDMKIGFYLEMQPDLKINHKIYGGANERADRIINTFRDRPASTGVVLQGEKGSGKTMLAQLLSQKLLKEGVSTLLVNAAYKGEAFNTFLNAIDQPTMIFFDEFEKVYTPELQNSLLTLFDGTHRNKKLFVVTLNDYYRVNDFMKNRPGRFYYSFKYDGLESREIREYCEDKLDNKDRIDSVISFATSFAKFNFDILKAIVEEMNRYKETVGEVVKHLNARPTESILRLQVKSIESPLMKEGMSIQGKLAPFNPFVQPFYLWASGGAKKKMPKAAIARTDDDDDDELFDDGSGDSYQEFNFGPEDLIKMTGGLYVFSNDKGTVTLEKEKDKPNGLEQFYASL